MRITASIAIVVLLLVVGFSPARAADTQKKPNVIFVLIDDMGYADFSCFGGKRAHTANIDRCAAEGIRFTQFYDSAPICSPSRTAYTTGQYPGRWAITSYLDNRKLNHQRGVANWLDPKAPSLARILHDAGYYTAHVGKWHMGGQRDVGEAPHIPAYGFDSAITTFEGLCDERILPTFEPYDAKDPFKYPQVRTAASLPGPFKMMPRYKVTEALVDRALREIKTAKDRNKPFYINLWPDDVHSPCEAPPDMRGDNTPPANYVGVLDELDKQFGRLFDAVKADPELAKNTIIIIASDNGPEKGLGYSDDLRGSKGQLYEGGIRLPLIVWAPTFMPKEAVGSTNGKTLVAGFDLAPSVLALTSVKTPSAVHFDGSDMSQTMLGKVTPADRGSTVMWLRPPDRPGPPNNRFPDLAIREGNMKLLVNRDGSKPQLYDVIKDPTESHDLSASQADLVKRLSDQVIKWDAATNRSTSASASAAN